MVGKWKVTCNVIYGEYMYAVVRERDTSRIDHSGNREYATGYMASLEDAEEIAAQLNSADGATAQAVSSDRADD